MMKTRKEISFVTLICLVSSILEADCTLNQGESYEKDLEEAGWSPSSRPNGWTEIQAINKHLDSLERPEGYQPEVLGHQLIDMVEALEGVNSVNSSGEKNVSFQGCNVDLLKQLARSLEKALQSCDSASMDFLDELRHQLLTPDQYLHDYALERIRLCLDDMSVELASQLHQSLTQNGGHLLSRIEEISNASQGHTYIDKLVALDSLRIIRDGGRKLAELLIQEAKQKTQIGEITKEDMAIKLENDLVVPCNNLIAGFNSILGPFRQYEGASESLHRALSARAIENDELARSLEMMRVCIELGQAKDLVIQQITMLVQ